MIEVAKLYSIEFMSKEGKSVNTLDKKMLVNYSFSRKSGYFN